MLTKEDITKLRELAMQSYGQNCLVDHRLTRGEMTEFLDAWLAWNLVEDERRRWYRFLGATDIRWVWANGQISWTRAKTGHERPQAAVLAVLGKKGEPDASKE